mmetsp:Transcript_1202/g.2769  ORF Transcript_1202/g.2769 Transcript_1202/m.2769 type:complete len:356 (-) Transcript_1202:238-1305(-)
MAARAFIVTVDLGPFMVDEGVVVGAAPTAAQQAVAAAIDEACRDHGFVQVTNFGVTAELRRRTFAAAEKLFAQPEAHKNECYRALRPETNTGYSGFGKEQLNRGRPADLKEAYNIRRPELAKNDFSGVPVGFEEEALELWRAMEVASRRYALACALALGLERDFFLRSLERFDLCTLRMLHYPPCKMPTPTRGVPAKTAIRVGEHTDFGAYTFLLLGDGAEGLQLKPVVGGEVGGASGGESDGWLDVAPEPLPEGQVGAFVNTGALLARWTNDTWRATAHRVIVPSAAVAAAHRYSIACFIDPDADFVVRVDPRFVRPGEALHYPPTTGLEYLMGRLKEAQENVGSPLLKEAQGV